MRKVSLLRGLPAVLAALLTTAPGAGALTLRVPAEHATIQAGLDAAASGDTVLVAPGTYTDWETRTDIVGNVVSTCAMLKAGVTLLSESGPQATVIDLRAADEDPRVLFATFQRGAGIHVEGFTVTGSVPGIQGARIDFCDAVAFRYCVFRGIGFGTRDEKAIYQEGTDLDLLGCSFVQNDADPAAVFLTAASGVVQECTFEGNRGPSLFMHTGFRPDANFSVRSCAFRSNLNVSSFGTLILTPEDGSAEVIGCRFEHNVSPTFGYGALYALALGSGPLDLRGNVFVENHGAGQFFAGGAAQLWTSGAVTVERNTFFRCSQARDASNAGAAIRIRGGVVNYRANVASECSGGPAVRITGDSITNDCNVYWKNPDGNLAGFVRGPNSRVLDPQVCDPGGGRLFLRGSSPCLPQNSRGCGRIGALERGCDPVSLTGESWGRVKGRYRAGR